MADPQELELQVFESCSVDAENQTQLPWVTQHSGLLNHLPSLKPFIKRPCLGLCFIAVEPIVLRVSVDVIKTP